MTQCIKNNNSIMKFKDDYFGDVVIEKKERFIFLDGERILGLKAPSDWQIEIETSTGVLVRRITDGCKERAWKALFDINGKLLIDVKVHPSFFPTIGRKTEWNGFELQYTIFGIVYWRNGLAELVKPSLVRKGDEYYIESMDGRVFHPCNHNPYVIGGWMEDWEGNLWNWRDYYNS